MPEFGRMMFYLKGINKASAVLHFLSLHFATSAFPAPHCKCIRTWRTVPVTRGMGRGVVQCQPWSSDWLNNRGQMSGQNWSEMTVLQVSKGHGLDAGKFWEMLSWYFQRWRPKACLGGPWQGLPVSYVAGTEFISRISWYSLSPLNTKGAYHVANQKHHHSPSRKQECCKRGKYLSSSGTRRSSLNLLVVQSFSSQLNKTAALWVAAPSVYVAGWRTGVTQGFVEAVLYSQKCSYGGVMLLAGLSGLGLLSDGCEAIEGKTTPVFVYLEIPGCRVENKNGFIVWAALIHQAEL